MIHFTPADPADLARIPLAFPDRLYGRQADLEALTRTFAEVGVGAGRVLLLPGHAGSGKTALVRTLRLPVQAKNGFFLEGKFNQYQQGIPLFAVRQALQQLAGELRATDPAEQQRWRTQILEAVGELGRLLTDVAPEWEAFLGRQPRVADISPFEAPHRFATVLQRFLGVFCRAEHPVVLFLDDWQWADAASLALLQQLQIHTTLRYVLVLAAYRDNEVDSSHPFLAAIEELRRQAVPLTTLAVRPLAPADIHALLCDTLTPAVEDAASLASFLHDTTQGNPFFLRALLESLHAQRAFWFNAPYQSWCWSRPTLVARGIPQDVVQLFVQHLLRLPEESRELLALAACLGNRFELETLAMVSEQPASACVQRLGVALEQRVILPVAGSPGHFLFQHDRVQQAAHSLIAPDQLPAVQLRIGRLLRERLTAPQLEERLLEVADHFNAGRALLRSDAEREHVVELNIAAGRKAHATTAYRAALQFHRVAGDFLAQPEFAAAFWRDRHPLALGFYKDWSESEFLEGDRRRAEACTEKALAHTRTPLEEADARCAIIQQHTLLGRYPEAIAAGRRALAALGIALPEADFETARDAEIAQVRELLAARTWASLREMPLMSDPSRLMVTRVLITLGPPSYRSHPRLWSVLVPKVVRLTLEHGPVPQIGYSHPAFGGLLGWVDNDFDSARQFSELAESLMRDVFPSPSDQSVFRLMLGSSTRHWFAPLRAASADYAHAWEAGLRSGNLQYAAYAFGHNLYCGFFQGLPLDRLTEESERSLAFSRTRTNQWAIDLLEGGLQVFGVLTGRIPIDGGSDAAYLDAVHTRQNLQVACIYRVLRAFSLLVLGETERARALSDEAEPMIDTVGTQGLLPWPEHVFTRVLILAAAYPGADAARQSGWRGEIDRAVARLEVWAVHAPETYRFKLAMARAEIAWLEGRVADALERYEEAVEGAAAGHFTQWEAWANERAAQLARALGETSLAQVHWQNAYVTWHRWGALAKVDRLERELLAPSPGTQRNPALRRGQLERYLESLRTRAARWAGAPVDREPTALVRELADATERLREEVARRKEAEAELQRHRDQLSQEIEARTRDLQASQELARKSDAQNRELIEQRQGLMVAQAAMLNLIEDATTARDRAEQANAALRQSEHKARQQAEELETLMDLAPLAIWVAHDPECRRITGNHTANAFFGAGAGENVSAGSADGAKQSTPRRFFRNGRELAPEELPMQQALRTNAEVRGFELNVVGLGSRTLTLLGNASPLRDETGRTRGCIGCFMDITERKQVEEALSQRERQLQSAQAVAHLGSWHLDLAQDRLTWSAEVCRIFARPAPPRSYEEFLAAILPEDRAALDHAWQATLGGAPYDLEHRIVADGAIKWVHQKASLEYDGQGQPLGCLGTVQDITERKHAEEALRQSEEQFRTMFELASIGMAQANPADGRWLRVNQKFCGITGFTEAELLQLGAADITHPEDRPRDLRLFEQVVRGEIPDYHLEKRYTRKDGRLAWVNVNLTVLRDTHGRPLRTMAAIEDITDRKRLELERAVIEAQMRQQQKLESIGTLASGVAHEINNPINGIMNYAQLIQDRLPGGSTLAEFTGEIMHETQRVATIVRNLLTFARNEKQSHSPARLQDIVEAVLSLVRSVIRHDQITLNVRLAEDLPPLNCRSQQLQQVIMNLITNARDALNERFPGHHPDKVLTLEARSVEKAGRPWIRLTVEDHGSGIRPEVRERMFDPFFTTKSRTQGTGLGLSISHGIVKEHHGEWAVESEPNRFTRMHVDLPADNGFQG